MVRHHRKDRFDGSYNFSILVTKELSFDDALEIAEDVSKRSDAVGIHPVVGGIYYDVWREPEDRYDLKHLKGIHGKVTAKSCSMIWDQGLLIKDAIFGRAVSRD